MSFDDWTINRATRGACHVEAVQPDTFGGTKRFAYMLTRTLETACFEDRLESGFRTPQVRRVAIRRTFREIDRLAKKWQQTPQPELLPKEPLVRLALEALK